MQFKPFTFSAKDIDNILFSGIRNEKVLKLRKKSYIRKFLSLSYRIIFKKSFNRKIVPNHLKGLNYLNNNYFNPGLSENLGIEYNLKGEKLKSLLIVECLLILAFIFNKKLFQKGVFKLASKITQHTLEKYNIQFLLCGHPEFIITFVGYHLKCKGKKVITYQHGIYSISAYEVLWFEKNIATHILVFGELFKQLYVKQGVQAENIVKASPYFGSSFKPDKENKTTLALKNRKALFLGQQLYKAYDVNEEYNQVLADLINYLNKEGVDLYYKPHPREDISKSLNADNNKNMVIWDNSILQDNKINDFDVYYSVVSSLLIEIFLKQKPCFQVDIRSDKFQYDVFENFTSIPMLDIYNLNNHLKRDYQFFYKSNYLNISENHNEYINRKLFKILLAN